MTGPQPHGLRLHVHSVQDTQVVAAIGEVDMATAPILRDQIAHCLAEPSNRLIIDLTAVTFLSSAGLNVLVQAHSQIRRLGIVAVGRTTLRPLQLAGLDQTLTVYPSLAKAVADTVTS